MVTFGILHVDVLGAVVGWKWITVGCLGVIVFWAVLMLFIPETPHYLLTERKYEAARTSLEFLRGHAYIENELAEIQESVEDSARTRATASDLLKPQNLKPLLISILLMFGQQFSGMNAIMLSAQALVPYGSKVVVLLPSWPNIPAVQRIMGAKVEGVPIGMKDGKD